MKSQSPLVLVLLLLPSFLANLSVADDFNFFYFVLQWPGSYCDTKKSCCYPTTGKPAADFGIHGLWPNYNDGSWPSNCDPDSKYDKSKIEDLIGSMQKEWPTLACPSSDGTEFWSHEWEKHGTCSESILDQHAYFQSALNLKKGVNVLQALTDAGVETDGGFHEAMAYSLHKPTASSQPIFATQRPLVNLLKSVSLRANNESFTLQNRRDLDIALPLFLYDYLG